MQKFDNILFLLRKWRRESAITDNWQTLNVSLKNETCVHYLQEKKPTFTTQNKRGKRNLLKWLARTEILLQPIRYRTGNPFQSAAFWLKKQKRKKWQKVKIVTNQQWSQKLVSRPWTPASCFPWGRRVRPVFLCPPYPHCLRGTSGTPRDISSFSSSTTKNYHVSRISSTILD